MQSEYLLCQDRKSFCVLEVCGNCGSVEVEICTDVVVNMYIPCSMRSVSHPEKVITFVNVLNDITVKTSDSIMTKKATFKQQIASFQVF